MIGTAVNLILRKKKSYLNVLVHHNPTPCDKVQNIIGYFNEGLSYDKRYLKTEISFGRHHQILYSTCRRKRKSATPVDFEVNYPSFGI